MISRKDARALVLLRLMASVRVQTNAHLRPLQVLRGAMVEKEWERLGIWREYPMDKLRTGNLYAGFSDLAGVGLIDDFAGLRTFAKSLHLSVPMIRGIWLIGDESKKLTELRERYKANRPSMELALGKARRAGLITWEREGRDEVVYHPASKVARKAIASVVALMDKQEDWTMEYQINEAGKAAATRLGDDWAAWPPLKELHV